jgi:hypothetical protein
MQPSGSTPPSLPPQPPTLTSSSSSAGSAAAAASLYPQVFPPNNPTMHNDVYHPSHHQYGPFSTGFTGQMAMACSSNGYPAFFPSKNPLLFRCLVTTIYHLFSFSTQLRWTQSIQYTLQSFLSAVSDRNSIESFSW